ncbi:MAG: hypothetical protein KA066_00280 [Candidatus Pacebacteria bacterium]|nr:hypothetical protein [Candidatus Paceibacterota bacterium]
MDVLTILIVAGTVSAAAVTFVLVAYLVGNPLPWMWRHKLPLVLTLATIVAVAVLWYYHADLLAWLKNQLPVINAPVAEVPKEGAATKPYVLPDWTAAWGMHALFAALAAFVVVLMLVAAFKALRTAFSGWGLVWAVTLFALLAAMFLFASPHLAAFAAAVAKRVDETTREEALGLIIFTLVMFVLTVKLLLGASTRWTTAATVAAVVLISILVGPAVIDWTNKNTPICFGEAACYKMEVRQRETEAQTAYAKQLAIAKAQRDSQRLVSPACPGSEQVLSLRPDVTSHINLNKCAVQAEVLSGKVIFVDWTGLRESKPLSPREATTIDFVIAGAYAAPGYQARIKYSLCSSASKIPLTYDCVPR